MRNAYAYIADVTEKGKPFARRLLTHFLKTRRAALRPADVGLPSGARLRRTAGLRRAEVAQLAGMSVEWYTLFEMGRERAMTLNNISSVTRALRLTDTERKYLYDLVRADPPRDASLELSPAVDMLLRETEKLVVVYDRWLNAIRWNAGAGTLFSIDGAPPEESNVLWRYFCAPDSRERFSQWEERGLFFLGLFRRALGRDPANPEAHRILASLKSSAQFRATWDLHEVRSLDDEARTLAHKPLQVTDPKFGKLHYYVAGFPIPASAGGQVRIAVPMDAAGREIVRSVVSSVRESP